MKSKDEIKIYPGHALEIITAEVRDVKSSNYHNIRLRYGLVPILLVAVLWISVLLCIGDVHGALFAVYGFGGIVVLLIFFNSSICSC